MLMMSVYGALKTKLHAPLSLSFHGISGAATPTKDLAPVGYNPLNRPIHIIFCHHFITEPQLKI